MITRKYSILYLLAFLLTMGISPGLQAQDDAIARFFERYVEDETFTSIYISPRMFRLFANLDKEDDAEDVKEAINKLGGLRILSADSISDGWRYYKEFESTLQRNQYEELMRVKDGKERLLFLIQEAGEGRVKELLMLVGGDHNFFMLSIIGDIDLNTISKITKDIGIEGMENLEKLEEENKNE